MMLIAGCKKNTTTSTNNSPAARVVTVLEQTSNKPVKDAQLYFEKCSSSDYYGFCPGYIVLKQLTTGNDGTVLVPGNVYYEYIRMEHEKYWSKREQSNSAIITVSPKSTIKAIVKNLNTYLPGDLLQVSFPDFRCIYCPDIIATMHIPADTVLFFTGRGNAQNSISWQVFHLDNTTSDTVHRAPVYVNGFDTATVNIEY